jgi:hypothetical protein
MAEKDGRSPLLTFFVCGETTVGKNKIPYVWSESVGRIRFRPMCAGANMGTRPEPTTVVGDQIPLVPAYLIWTSLTAGRPFTTWTDTSHSAVESHISRKTSEIWGTLPSWQVKVLNAVARSNLPIFIVRRLERAHVQIIFRYPLQFPNKQPLQVPLHPKHSRNRSQHLRCRRRPRLRISIRTRLIQPWSEKDNPLSMDPVE